MQRYLERGEEVQLAERPHEAALVRPLARSLLLAAAGLVLVVLGLRFAWGVGAAGVLLLLGAAILALADVWRWDRTQLVLTNQKLFVVHGVARRHAAGVRLSHAGPIEVEQDVLGRLLGYGTLIAGDLEIPFVPNPRELYRLLR